MRKRHPVLLVSSMIGFGDLLYHTPVIRRLKKTYPEVHIWCFNPEPMLRNPNIDKLYRITSADLPVPDDFYLFNQLHLNKETQVLRHEHCHTIDYVSVNTLGIELPYFERELELHPGNLARNKAAKILLEHNLKAHDFVVISPSSGWRSRTLPSSFYSELVGMLKARGKRVVVVGKAINPTYVAHDSEKVNEQEKKGLIQGDWLTECVDLTNKLSFHESAAVLALAQYAVLGETGVMVLASTTHCPFVYLPQLMPPEFRLPWRRGILGYGVEVVKREIRYFDETEDDSETLVDLPPWIPPMNEVAKSCDRLENWITKEGAVWTKEQN